MASVSSNKSNDDGLRPHGRSGLKFLCASVFPGRVPSPPPRAEWIEIFRLVPIDVLPLVSAPTGGVD